jgi:hypothetical protein
MHIYGGGGGAGGDVCIREVTIVTASNGQVYDPDTIFNHSNNFNTQNISNQDMTIIVGMGGPGGPKGFSTSWCGSRYGRGTKGTDGNDTVILSSMSNPNGDVVTGFSMIAYGGEGGMGGFGNTQNDGVIDTNINSVTGLYVSPGDTAINGNGNERPWGGRVKSTYSTVPHFMDSNRFWCFIILLFF